MKNLNAMFGIDSAPTVPTPSSNLEIEVDEFIEKQRHVVAELKSFKNAFLGFLKVGDQEELKKVPLDLLLVEFTESEFAPKSPATDRFTESEELVVFLKDALSEPEFLIFAQKLLALHETKK